MHLYKQYNAYIVYISAYSVYIKCIILANYNYQFSIVTNLDRASIFFIYNCIKF